jgi:uncharacterized protein (DUF305 family)
MLVRIVRSINGATMNRISASIAALVTLAGAALAQQTTPMPEMDKKGMDMDQGMMKPIPGEPSSTAGYKTAMMKMMMNMPKFTGDADIDFMKQMRPHHQAAIDMAQIVLKDGKNPETKKLATAIIAAQKKEIMTIDTWLKKNGAM